MDENIAEVQNEAGQENEADKEKEKEEMTYLEEYLTELTQRRSWKSELRKSNLNVDNRPEESDLHKLDSSLKKNTAFVRKVKNFTEAQKDAILKEMTTLNLTKYIGEVATGIVEAKLKMNDLPGIIEICSKLHQRYAEFSPLLLTSWQKVLGFKKDDKLPNASKLRVDVRFYCDLVSVGVFGLKDSLPLLGNVLTSLVAMDKEEHSNIAIILTFCKHCGDEYAGLVPSKIRLLSQKFGKEIPQAHLLPPDKQKNVRQMLRDYFTTVCKHLTAEHSELLSVERTNRRIMITKGEVHVERKERAEALQNAFSKLFSNAEALADILDEELPELTKEDPKRKNQDDDLDGIDDDSEIGVDVGSGVSSLMWEDDDMKNFYENLSDLKPIVPAILYKDSLAAKKSSEAAPKASEVKVEETAEVEDEDEDDLNEPLNEDEEIAPPDIEDDVEEGETQNTSSKMLLDAFLSNLPNCVNREMIDSAAAEFCLSLNTKINRKKLVKSLFSVHRNRQDLLPFYARFVATLNPLLPDIATDLGQYLKQEFRWQVRKKDQMKIESKLKVCRFIGELVKFGMFPKSECLFCLKQLLLNFSHHHIDMACTFMEVCGRFLYYSPDSHRKTKIYLEQMMRKKIAISMDSRYIMMIENAYYSVNPPDMQQEARPKRPPLELYVTKLLYTDLGKNNTEKILKIIRRLNWDNQDEVAFAVKLLGDVWNFKFFNIRYAASLLAGLACYHEWVALEIVDNILEDIRLMMEVNLPKYNQRRISVVKFLAELYNYRIVDSILIIQVLYLLITFGSGTDEQISLDPPDHLLRVRLVCTILDTCGCYFNTGSNKKKLDYFLIYFQRYYLRKRCSPHWNEEENPFPFAISSQVTETLPPLRQKFVLMTSLEDAEAAVKKIEEETMSKIREKVPELSKLFERISISGSGSPTPDNSFTLQTIDEDADEDDEMDERHSTSRSRSRSASLLKNRDDVDDDIDDDGSREEDVEDRSQEEEVEDDEEERLEEENVEFHIQAVPKHINCDEDDDFVSMFDKMLNENIAESRNISTRVAGSGQQVPSALGRSNKKTYDQLMASAPVDTVQFAVLMRKGTKQAYREVSVAADSDIARNLQKQEEADRIEKERVKKLTLEMNERQEEEDLHEAIAPMQRPLNMINRNPDRRNKPMKGTPDADEIFGSKRSAR